MQVSCLHLIVHTIGENDIRTSLVTKLDKTSTKFLIGINKKWIFSKKTQNPSSVNENEKHYSNEVESIKVLEDTVIPYKIKEKNHFCYYQTNLPFSLWTYVRAK